MDLREWAREFLRHRDLFARKIVAINDTSSGLSVVYRDRKVDVIVCDSLAGASPSGEAIIVVPNTRGNLDCLLKRWGEFVGHASLTIYFVNTRSQTEQKWVIRPSLHNRVADDESLRQGLMSLFSTVDPAG